MKKIVFENVSLNFGRHEIFKNLSCELDAGKVFGIIGKNGAGKSTFLKLAAQIIKPAAGEVKILGLKNVAAVTPELKIYDDLTAAENLKFFAKLRSKAVNLAEMGARVDLDFENEIRAGDFSTGMKQRLKFAILLSVDADIWLLDEPTANLDDSGRKIFYREIRRGAAEKLILLATNDAADLEVCDEIIKLPI